MRLYLSVVKIKMILHKLTQLDIQRRVRLVDYMTQKSICTEYPMCLVDNTFAKPKMKI